MSSPQKPPLFTPYQIFVVAMLAFLQFTIILDFMIPSPMGAILMPELKMSPAQFGMVVSAYAFSAGLSGLLAAGFADLFDRKKLLLFFYTGFVVGTFLCGIATSFETLLGARVITGLFGGVIGAIVYAITADLFPLEKRGRVMGFVQTAFAASQVLGIPLGIHLSTLWGWHAPFMMIVAVSAAVGLLLLAKLRPIREHLDRKTDHHPFHHLFQTVSNPRHLRASGATTLLATGGFMMMPFSSAFNVHNLGVPLEMLPLIYLVTGGVTIVAGPLIGRAADSFGKFRVFFLGSLISLPVVVAYTSLGPTSLAWVIALTTILFIGISLRIVPFHAIMSAVPDPHSRGSFLSVNSSIQQLSGGLASIAGGYIVTEGPNGSLEHFDTLGLVVAGAIVVTLVQMYFIHREVVGAR